MSTILGIDPGSIKTGYGVIQIQHNQAIYLASGCIAAKGSLSKLFEGIQKVMHQYQPNEAAIEQVFVNINTRSALVLGQARGVALLALELAQLPVKDYAARQVKQAIVGYGAATKAQMQYMIKQLLNLPSCLPEDSSDALGVALCHYSMRNRSKIT